MSEEIAEKEIARGEQVPASHPDDDLPVAKRTRRLSSGNHANKPMFSNQDDEQLMIDNGAIKPQYRLANDCQSYTFEDIMEAYEKSEADRTEQDVRMLNEYAFLLPEVKNRIKLRQDKETLKQRIMEFEDSMDLIETKVSQLAELIRQSRHVIIYTGAGISTSASIPDYRGPNGLWTQIRRTGSFSMTKIFDLSRSEPTYTHMAIKELCRKRLIKHIVSQNCDGLHIRSGVAQSQLSEIHGNMYIEVCPTCERQYFRQADVTERTSRFRHKTGRKCHTCPEPNNNLIDTIVLYGERSRTKWPMNWERAGKAAKRADLIICMGSSLKTLRRYGCLWPKTIGNSSKKQDAGQTKLVIINLQYTSKDKQAVLKINGKCDLVMEKVMQRLNIEVPTYDWTLDPLLELSTPFRPDEREQLNRNLIFDLKTPATAGQQLAPPSPSVLSSCSSSYTTQQQSRHHHQSEARSSPSLFVSEITDDPEKKHLKMRIRALNVESEESGATVNDRLNGVDESGSSATSKPSINHVEIDRTCMSENLLANQNHSKHIPGWLGKSLGSVKASSYKRKKHGNKGRKHRPRQQASLEEPIQSTIDITATPIKSETLEI